MAWVMETKQLQPTPGQRHLVSISDDLNPSTCLLNVIQNAQELGYTVEAEAGPVESYLVNKFPLPTLWRIRVFEITDEETQPIITLPEYRE